MLYLLKLRQAGRTPGIIAPSSRGTLLLPFWASHLLRSAIRSLPALLGRVKTSVHQQAQPRFMVLSPWPRHRAGLAHMANHHHGVVGLADQSRALGV